MPSWTCAIASLECCSTEASWRRASRAVRSVLSRARSMRCERSSRVITACRRSALPEDTTSRAPLAMASAMRVSLTESSTTISGTAAASWSRTATAATRSSAAGLEVQDQFGVQLGQGIAQVPQRRNPGAMRSMPGAPQHAVDHLDGIARGGQYDQGNCVLLGQRPILRHGAARGDRVLHRQSSTGAAARPRATGLTFSKVETAAPAGFLPARPALRAPAAAPGSRTGVAASSPTSCRAVASGTSKCAAPRTRSSRCR